MAAATEHLPPQAEACPDDSPIVYAADGEFPEGRIVAVDFKGGSFDVRDTHGLTDLESNAFTLQALGYTLFISAHLLGRSPTAVHNRLNYMRSKTGTLDYDGPSSITKAFQSGLFRTTRPAPEPNIALDSRGYTIWNGAMHGISNARLARGLVMSERTVIEHNTRLYRRAGVANKCAATLLAHLIDEGGRMPPTDTSEPLFEYRRVEGGRRITSVRYNAGKFEARTDGFLTNLENNVTLLASTGMTTPGIAIALLGNELPSHISTVSNAERAVVKKYEVQNTDDVFRRACIAGHIRLVRECLLPNDILGTHREQLWQNVTDDLTATHIAEASGASLKAVKLQIGRLYSRLGANNKHEAAMQYWMTHPLPAMLPDDNTYAIRQAGGIRLPNPRTFTIQS